MFVRAMTLISRTLHSQIGSGMAIYYDPAIDGKKVVTFHLFFFNLNLNILIGCLHQCQKIVDSIADAVKLWMVLLYQFFCYSQTLQM